jgi:hypothetical protein
MLSVIPTGTLRKRFNPYATSPEPAPRVGDLPSPVDVRQMSLFGACWTLASIKHLAESAVSSATYEEAIPHHKIPLDILTPPRRSGITYA